MLDYLKKNVQLWVCDPLCYFPMSSDADGSTSSPKHAVSCILWNIWDVKSYLQNRMRHKVPICIGNKGP